MSSILRRWLAGSVLVALIGGPLAGSARADDFSKQKKTYKSYLRRDTLFMRTRGRNRFAATKDLRAFEILAKSYKSPEQPKDQVRYLIATICARHFQQDKAVEHWDAWRAKFTKPRDAWLWYKALQINQIAFRAQDLIDVAKSSQPMFQRMAAVEALADKKDKSVIELADELADAVPIEQPARAVLLESLMEALETQAERIEAPEFKEVAAKVIRHMDDDATTDRTRMVMARSLARLLKTDILGLTAAPWLLELKVATKANPQDERYAKKSTFIGIEATGMRIAYIIDTSDSMLTPLTGKELEDLRGPITGEGDPSRGGGDDLPWEKIENRFDAAREFLKLSLRNLDPDQYFNVIFFGTESERLRKGSGMMIASPANIKAAIKALDAIEKGPTNPRRPHGTLHGNTNIHGGFHRAFKLKAKGMVKTDEFVDPTCFEEGCDTIFLLSDGAPTWDDWAGRDERDPEDRGGDPEAGTGGQAQPTHLFYYGPYALPVYLVDDIQRLNLFRKCEIHCVGMGEARMPLLRRIAAIGHGVAKKIGEKEPEEDPKPAGKKKNP